jgi:hypothetical protein
MAKMLDSEEVFKNHFVIIFRNELRGFLEEYFTSDLRNKIQIIVKKCFKLEADLVFFFLNKSGGSFNCTCFLPIYHDKNKFYKNAKKTFKDIGNSIALYPQYLDTIDNLSDGITYSFVNLAFKCGYWQKEYSFVVSNKEGEN